MFINPKSPNYAPNQSIILSSIKPYILGFILSSINTPSHISALIHIARHTFGSLQVEAGTSIYVVQKMLAHKNVKTTQIYAAMADEQKRLSASRITLKPMGD